MIFRSLVLACSLLVTSSALAQSVTFPKGWDGDYLEWWGEDGENIKPTSIEQCLDLAANEMAVDAKAMPSGRMTFKGSKSLYAEESGDSEHPLNGKIRSLKVSGNGYELVVDNSVYPKAKGHISPIGPRDHPFGLVVTMPHLDYPKTQVVTGYYCRSK